MMNMKTKIYNIWHNFVEWGKDYSYDSSFSWVKKIIIGFIFIFGIILFIGISLILLSFVITPVHVLLLLFFIGTC